jgi:hypothetical protein
MLLFQPMPDMTTCMNPAFCPQNFQDIFDDACQNQAAVQNYCQTPDPPDSGQTRCLLSDREEDVNFSQLRNFEGVWEVPPHASAFPVYLLYQATPQLWADDVPYTLTIDWYQETSDQTKFWNGANRTNVIAQTFSQDPSWQSSGVAANPTPGITGSIAAGYGRLFNHDPIDGGQGIRGTCDYDAVPTQVDNYELDFPAIGAPYDAAWELQWSITNASGQTVHDVILEVTFCDASQAGIAGDPCYPATSVTNGNGMPQDIVYNQGAGQWFNVMGEYGSQQSPWTQVVTAGSTTTTANQYACMCFQPIYADYMGTANKVFIGVAATDRDSYVPATYTITTALAPYNTEWAYSNAQLCPQPGTLSDGGVGGCFFQ